MEASTQCAQPDSSQREACISHPLPRDDKAPWQPPHAGGSSHDGVQVQGSWVAILVLQVDHLERVIRDVRRLVRRQPHLSAPSTGAMRARNNGTMTVGLGPMTIQNPLMRLGKYQQHGEDVYGPADVHGVPLCDPLTSRGSTKDRASRGTSASTTHDRLSPPHLGLDLPGHVIARPLVHDIRDLDCAKEPEGRRRRGLAAPGRGNLPKGALPCCMIRR